MQAERRALLGHFSERPLSGVRRVPPTSYPVNAIGITDRNIKVFFFFLFEDTCIAKPHHGFGSISRLLPCPKVPFAIPRSRDNRHREGGGGTGGRRLPDISLASQAQAFQLDQRGEHTRRYGPIPSAMEFGSAQTYTCLSLGLGRYPLWASLRFHRGQIVWMESSTSLTGPERR